MPAKKNAPGAAPAPGPDMTVTALVRVYIGADDEARFEVSVDIGGLHAGLIKRTRPAMPKLNIAGAALRRVVMTTLDVKPLAPPAELKRMARGLARVG